MLLLFFSDHGSVFLNPYTFIHIFHSNPLSLLGFFLCNHSNPYLYVLYSHLLIFSLSESPGALFWYLFLFTCVFPLFACQHTYLHLLSLKTISHLIPFLIFFLPCHRNYLKKYCSLPLLPALHFIATFPSPVL